MDVRSLAQFDNIQADLNPKIEIIVLFFFEPRVGQCSRLKSYFEYLSEEVDYKDRVLFVQCNKESSNHDIFEKYDVKSIPTFLFIKNKTQVESSSTESPRELKADIDRLLGGGK